MMDNIKCAKTFYGRLMTLLLCTTTVVAQAPMCSPDILAAVTLAETQARILCDVSDLSSLVGPAHYVNTNTINHFAGSPNFCNATCIDAISAIVRAWGKHDCEDEGTDYGMRRSIHRRILSEQYECDPPKQLCVDILSEIRFWQATPEGQTCIRKFHNATSAASSGAISSHLYHDYCTGECYDTLNSKLQLMFDSGCNSWPAYLDQKETLETFCSQDTAGTYCHHEYLGAAMAIENAFDLTKSTSQRNSYLTTLCTLCFRTIQSLQMQNFAVLRRFSREPELCIQDRELLEIGGNPRYCLPLFDEKESIIAGSGSNYPLANMAENMCKNDMGRCANRIWSHRLSQWTTNTAEAVQFRSLIQYSCLEFVSAGQSAMCNNVANIKRLESGHFTESSPNLPRPCTPTSITGECEYPTLCQSNWDGTCQPQCQISVDEILLTVGCCFNSWKHFIGNYTLQDASANFARIEFLEDECCNMQTTPYCNDRIEPACAYYNFATSLATTLQIPFKWVDANMERFNTSVKADIARSLGVLEEAISLQVIEGIPASNPAPGAPSIVTRIVFDVGSTTSVTGAKLQRSWDHINPVQLTSPVAADFTETNFMYRSRCLSEDIPIGVPCSSAQYLQVSIHVLVLGLAAVYLL